MKLKMKQMLSGATIFVLMLLLLTGCGQSIESDFNEAEDTQTPLESQEEPQEELSEPEWEMKREVEYVVPASPGGGSDISARVIADIVQKNSLAPKSLMVVNKPGGACAVGYNYVGTQKGDPYTLLSLHSGNLIVSYVNDWDLKYDDLTDIIAIMAFDDITLCVNAEGPYSDLESLLTAARENPNEIRFGSDQRGNSSQLCYEMLQRATGVELNYVQYDSSGDVAGALLGGHVDIGILNPGECISQVEAGKFIPVVTFAPERLTGVFKDVPTFAEAGYDDEDLIFREYRGLSGAKDMPVEAREFYEKMAEKITETEQWKNDYVAKNALTPVFMGHEEATKFAQNDIDIVMSTFTEIGHFD